MQSKAGFDSRSRDIRRRVDVIQKKLADLQELGIPCAFCYSSVRNTGSLFTLGDKRITDVIERHKNEILRNLIDGSFELTKEIHLILPPLPNTLDQLSRHTMQSLIIGILKDLGVKWSDPKPAWWPLEIPFVPPRSVPENFTGNWTQALKRVIESVYSYFSYDVDTYIAGNLDCSLEEGESESSVSDIETTSKTNEKQPHQASSMPAADVSPKKPPNKVSSFTVENILNSPNSAGSSNSSHSPPQACGNTSTPAFQTSGSWPSVKYTKFTMLSPAIMKSGSRGRSSNGPNWVQSTEFSSNEKSAKTRSEGSGPLLLKTAVNPPSTSGESSTSLVTTSHPVIQPSEPTARQTTPDRPGSSEYHFPPSHRYIVLLPPNSKTMGAQSLGEAVASAPTNQSCSPPTTEPSDCIPTLQPAVSQSMPHIHSSQVAAEPGYRPIAPKTEAMMMAEVQAVKNQDADNSSKKSKKVLSKRPRLRFHMTTIVKKAKRRNATTSMTAPPPSLCSPNGSSRSAGKQTLGSGESFRPIAPKAHTITTSPNMHSIKHSADQSATSKSDLSTERESSSQEGMQPEASVPQTSVLKDSGFHLQLVKQTLSDPSSNAGAKRGRRGGSRGRGARGYTRRKRGLTFHLYEDPSTAFRAKRTRQH